MANIENLKKLKAWLEDGAPHVKFDMNVGIKVTRNEPGDGACGTSCCIAGAACAMSRALDPADRESLSGLMDWGRLDVWEQHATGDPYARRGSGEFDYGTVQAEALKWLGLKPDLTWMGHDLFDNRCAPVDCTPEQAAQAVQNVIDGKPAWEDVE